MPQKPPFPPPQNHPGRLSKATEHRYDQLSRPTYGHDEFSEDDGSSETDSDMELD